MVGLATGDNRRDEKRCSSRSSGDAMVQKGGGDLYAIDNRGISWDNSHDTWGPIDHKDFDPLDLDTWDDFTSFK